MRILQLALGIAGILAIWLVPGASDYPVSTIAAVGLVAFGVTVGAYGTIIGAGGGFLIVPMLVLVLHLPPAQAAGTSLAVVFLNAVAGSISYARQKRVDYHAGLWFAAATFPGAVAGAFLAKYFSGQAFDLTFAAVLLTVAAFLMWKPLRETETVVRQPYNMTLGLAISFGIGFISSALGIGGGIFHVPAMIYLFAFPAAIAAATSTFILAFSSLIGAATHVSLGNVLFGPAALMGIGVIAGAQIGVAIARRAKSVVVVRLLASALVLVAIRLIVR